MNDENNNVQNVNNNEKETIQNIENNNVENNVVQNEMNQNIVKNQDSSNQNMQEQITTNNNSNDEDSDTVNLKRVKDLIIAISLSGNTQDIVDSLRVAKKNKTRIIAITNHIISPVAQLADYVLLTAGRETLLDGGSLIAKISQLYVIDVLCTGYALKNKEYAMKMKQNTAQSILFKNRNV